MYEDLKSLIEMRDFTISEAFTIAPRIARTKPIPDYLFASPVGNHIKDQATEGGELWFHQALGLEKLGSGSDVVVATSTASGKSLIFRSYAFHKLLSERSGRVLVFYPLKALAADQLGGWVSMAKALGLGDEVIGRIDGSVPFQERDSILAKCQIILMTPDVCHAWMLSRLSTPVVKTFVRQLSLLVMDEAHTLEGVFGSNVAYLLRRLYAVRRYLLKDNSEQRRLQYVAATATIANPQTLLESMTGVRPDLVGQEDDGSPHSETFCAHLVSPPGQEMAIARSIHTALAKSDSEGGFITFVDSRKGVEMLAQSSQSELSDTSETGDGVIMPYRAGYGAEDRRRIEIDLRKGRLRGVVTTSALEMGIDLPHLVVGLNVGVPNSRKSYRQRLGRVGRRSEGAFLVVAPFDAFTGFGMTFREYHASSVEPSYQYLDNRFMQFAHARCLLEELGQLGAPESLPRPKSWPNNFPTVFEAARPGGHRPPEFDPIAQLGGDTPQRGYPLRNVGEVNFKIAISEQGESFGEVNESQALRECYPGASYLHLARTYEVAAWHTNTFMPFIRVKPCSPRRRTTPRITTWVNAGITPADVLEGNLIRGENGFLAECHMLVTEKVNGYMEEPAGVYRDYKELRQSNPNMRARMRNFRTSGVVLSIGEEWFKSGDIKHLVVDRLTAIFAREFSIIPQDIGTAASNISIRTLDGAALRGNCVVVFDQTYGSLRLTERWFREFRDLLARLEKAAEVDAAEGEMMLQYTVPKLKAATEHWERADVGLMDKAIAADGSTRMQVFTPGSRVCIREKGALASDVEVVQPTVMDGSLMYQVKAPAKFVGGAPVKRWVAAEYVEPSAEGDAWEYGWWESETETFEDIPEA